jgi:hypothetical protein
MRKVKFPQFIDRAPLLFIFELDMMLVMFGSTILILWALSKVATMIIAIPVSFYLGFKAMTLFEIAKYEMSPGFIKHFFYKVGLYKPALDFEKYPELRYRDNKEFYPSGYITDFTD